MIKRIYYTKKKYFFKRFFLFIIFLISFKEKFLKNSIEENWGNLISFEITFFL
jgi:hypothetical protein